MQLLNFISGALLLGGGLVAVEGRQGRGESFDFGDSSVGYNSVPRGVRNARGRAKLLQSMQSKRFETRSLAPAPPAITNDDAYSEDNSDVRSGYVRTFNNGPPNMDGLLKSTRAVNYGNQAEYDFNGSFQNQFLKRGLTLLDELDARKVGYDRVFMETLKKFHARLLQKGTPFLADYSVKWRSRAGERPYRTDKLFTRWKSVDCGVLDLQLKMVGSIYEGHRNRVIKLYDRTSQQTFAYKTYGNPDEFYAEIEMFLWLDHPYFIKAICHRKDSETGKAGILFDYVEGSSSIEYARRATPDQLQRISAQLFVAMEHLHWLGVVHADLKPENVLITKEGKVQVIDFGFAIHLPQSKRRRGTHTTMAPELHMLVPGRCHEAIDWWAYGSTVAMWYGVNVNYRDSETSPRYIAMDWIEGHYVMGTVPQRFTFIIRNFLSIFFQADPEARRINTRRALQQVRDEAFFNGLDWSSVYGGILE